MKDVNRNVTINKINFILFWAVAFTSVFTLVFLFYKAEAKTISSSSSTDIIKPVELTINEKYDKIVTEKTYIDNLASKYAMLYDQCRFSKR